nr:hypothetical protein Iba_chr02aCG8590 [Ipomoea batatas]GMC62822.1 hypothetical protein Iba_chr02cCG7480 [Ipomoea batatas]
MAVYWRSYPFAFGTTAACRYDDGPCSKALNSSSTKSAGGRPSSTSFPKSKVIPVMLAVRRNGGRPRFPSIFVFLRNLFENEIVIEIIHHHRGLIVGIGIGILWPATKDIVEHGTLTIVEEGVANQEMEEKDMEADVEDDDFAAEHHVADEECCTGDCDWYADEEDTAG